MLLQIGEEAVVLLPLPARLGEVRHSLPLSSAGLSPVAPRKLSPLLRHFPY